ncbi:uncharacterized protein LOC128232073 [Mya arenaria]|uniref:uncharacterized protein LOC128232073 n=1 Tax=Mya arenaria TaxID=6604 RepID=UPI0022E09E6F|nr:uncharacterized protein LOC128232073 [Mya arenaria]
MSERRVKQKKKGVKETPAEMPATIQRPDVKFRLKFSDLWENPELVLTNMAPSWLLKAGSAIPEFLLGKFPYIQAVTLLMLLAERALKMEKYPPMHPYIIYAVSGLCLLSGVMFTAKIKVKHASLIYCLVLAYLAVNAYTNKQFNYSRHVRNRLSSRHLGCLGLYILYAFMKSGRESKLMQRVGELCLATYLCAQAYLLNESYEDKKAIDELVPGGIYARYVFTLLFACAGLCFIAGYFLKDISLTVAFVVSIYIILVDMKFWFWQYRGTSYWNQVRLLIDNVNIVAGFFLLMNHYENLTEKDQDEGDANEEDREKQD